MNEHPQITRRALAGASESVRKLNPHLFGPAAVGGAESKPNKIPALVKSTKARRSVARGVVVCVAFISCRRQLLDSDNLQAAHKGLRDAVARSLGIDDADQRVRWEYGQVETRGQVGTVVLVSEC